LTYKKRFVPTYKLWKVLKNILRMHEFCVCIVQPKSKEIKKNKKMSLYVLTHLHSDWAVAKAIVIKEKRFVIIWFNHVSDQTFMQKIDRMLGSVEDVIKNLTLIYVVDITQVTLFTAAWEGWVGDPTSIKN